MNASIQNILSKNISYLIST